MANATYGKTEGQKYDMKNADISGITPRSPTTTYGMPSDGMNPGSNYGIMGGGRYAIIQDQQGNVYLLISMEDMYGGKNKPMPGSGKNPYGMSQGYGSQKAPGSLGYSGNPVGYQSGLEKAATAKK
jgi:hypothetical protein